MTVPLIRLVDDEPSVRRALSRLLASAGYASAGYASAEDFLGCDDDAPGCAVVDLHLPGWTGLELQARLAEHESCLPVIFLTGRGDIATSVQAMKGGAVDFLTKPVEAQTLITAVEQALEINGLARARRQADVDLNDCIGSLTPREAEVMELVIAGFLNKQIAAELGIVEKTVKIHRGRVMQKMKVRTAADLIRFVVLHRG